MALALLGNLLPQGNFDESMRARQLQDMRDDLLHAAARAESFQQFRRYVRVPVMTEVGIVMADGARITATSQEISSGGMSLKGHHVPEVASQVEVSFSLLTLPRVWVRGHVTWKKPNKSFGIRFDSTDDRRHRLKEWIVAYLEA